MLAMLGHDVAPVGYWTTNLATGAPLTRCPRRVELDASGSAAEGEVAEARAYWPHYKRGFLPVAGGVSEQPALTLDLLAELDALEQLTKAKFLEIERANASDGSAG
jgi:hypothetical protein